MFSNRKKLKIQGKDKGHRKALVKSLIIELIRTERIKTTPKKAKVLKANFDRVVTAYKKNTIASIKVVKSVLGNNDRAFDRLGELISEKLADRNSGYTRLIKTLSRKGDNAEQTYVMLVNTEVKDKSSRLKRAMEKKEENQAKQATGVRGALNKVVGNVTTVGRKNIIKETDIRRNSK